MVLEEFANIGGGNAGWTANGQIHKITKLHACFNPSNRMRLILILLQHNSQDILTSTATKRATSLNRISTPQRTLLSVNLLPLPGLDLRFDTFVTHGIFQQIPLLAWGYLSQKVSGKYFLLFILPALRRLDEATSKTAGRARDVIEKRHRHGTRHVTKPGRNAYMVGISIYRNWSFTIKINHCQNLNQIRYWFFTVALIYTNFIT